MTRPPLAISRYIGARIPRTRALGNTSNNVFRITVRTLKLMYAIGGCTTVIASLTTEQIIPIAFLTVIADPQVNFANAGNNCTAFTGSTLLDCPQLEQDITDCQQTYGKTILLSVGGATYSEGGFSTSDAAVTAANNIWSLFGPASGSTSTTRPFGTAAVDGFDFDFESTVSNMPAFGEQLRSLMDADAASTGKKWLLTAAPQCPYPDTSDNPMLDGTVYFDIIWIQFYNNFCGLTSFTVGSSTQNTFNYDTWDTWAKTVSLNPSVKLMLGIPAASTINDYEDGTVLADIISYCKTFSTFAGVMMWDMSLLYANVGFLDAVKTDLGVTVSTTISSPGTAPSSTTTAKPSTTATGSAPATTTTAASGTVGQWNQCGGQGWTGGTVCISPYKCTVVSTWYSQCE
ncbi:MAG: Chitinase 1 [Claussenomyces sp. TS43310]|nr:MAG: Chitinase 1 [Claussenomyces sp. TS43310]